MVGSAVPAAVPARGTRRQPLPVVLAVGASVLAVGAFVLQVLAGGDLLRNYMVVDAVLALASVNFGAFVWRRVPGNPVGPLYVLSGSAYAVASGVTGWVTGAAAYGWPGLSVAAWLGEWVYVAALAPQITLLLLLFPDGLPPSPAWRWVGRASVVVAGLLAAVFAVTPRVHVDADTLVANPVVGWAPADAVVGPLLLTLGACALASAASLLLRMRAADPHQRQAMAPYVAAAGVVVAALAAVQLGPAWWEPVAQTLVLPLLPLAATVGVLRYRLYDVEVVVRRSLVWLALTAFVVAGYALVVQAVAALLHRQAGLPESLLAVGAVAAVFQPTRLWLQQLVGRALYGHRNEPEQALAELGRALSVTADPGTALQDAAVRLTDALALPWVAVSVARDDAEPHLVSAGSRPAWAGSDRLVEVPLVHAGVHVGRLLASRRSPREPLSARDVRLLETLAYPVAATAAAYQLTDDLRRSRERVVRAREEERRRLRHDLHDDLAPLLASFTLQLDAAALRQQRTGSVPAELLTELRTFADEAVATVRRSVEVLRPAALGELGLLPALREQAARLRSDEGPDLVLDVVPDLPPLPAATEVAALRIATEALTNAVRHADAARVSVAVTQRPGALLVTVEDDGRGLPDGPHAGVGLGSMRERAEELGGILETQPVSPHGTRISAVLPLPNG
jgi:signal transduction histidine kinase